MAKQFFAAKDVNTARVNEFFKKRNLNGENIQSVQIYIDNELKLRFSPAPYDCSQRKEIYSLSKSFSSVAIGILCDRKLLSVEDRIVDLFPDKLPEQVSEHLAAMKVKHLLTMTTGHEACIMKDMYRSTDAAKAFLAQPVPRQPGTFFMYNTGASCMLAEITERITGRKLFDFAYENIFEPLEFDNPYWTTCAQGVNEGGIGLHISNDDLAKFGLMLYNHGVYNGKRILSEEWCRAAGSAQVDNSYNGDGGSGNWTSGYGYQFWMTKRDGYRGDGLAGQLCMVMPKNKAVVAINARTVDMEPEIVDVVDLVEHLLDPVDQTEFIIPDYEPIPVNTLPEFCKNSKFRLNKNGSGFTELHIKTQQDKLILDLFDGYQKQTIHAGLSSWCESEYYAAGRVPKILSIMDPYKTERIHLAACAGEENGDLKIIFRHLSDPQTEELHLSVNQDQLSVTFSCIQDMLAEDCVKWTGTLIQ